MRRGELWYVTGKGDYAEKPRPYMIVQRSEFIVDGGSVTMIPITGELGRLGLIRVRLDPDNVNGLDKSSDIMVDKIQTMKISRLKQKIGEVSPDVLEAVQQKIAFFLGM